MPNLTWTKDTYEASNTRACFSSTPYDTGWDGAPQWGIDGAQLRNDPEMQTLLVLEGDIAPLSGRTRKIAGQVEQMPPCGWAFPQIVEAICANIGADDAGAMLPGACYCVGQERLDLLARYACCLDGWVKGATPARIAAQVRLSASGDRDWSMIAENISQVLGARSDAKELLTRRLLLRLRFWLRAPYGTLKVDANPQLGYFYDYPMGRHGGWDYFSFHQQDPEIGEVDERINFLLTKGQQWIDLIDCTWPCAPKIVRYLERLILAIGGIDDYPDDLPSTVADHFRGQEILQTSGSYLDTQTSRALYHAALSVLSRFVDGAIAPPPESTARDKQFALRLKTLLGDPTPEKRWLAALLAKRISLFAPEFKSFHFTRNMRQVT